MLIGTEKRIFRSKILLADCLIKATLYFNYNPSQTHKTVESEKGYYPIVKVMHCSNKMDTYKHIEQVHVHKFTVDINRKEVFYSYA
jgi:hypothetical protein